MSEIGQTRKNFWWNTASLIINIVVGILYTPFLVRTLGVTAYGIVPLALIINQYVSVITSSLTGSLTRFYSISFQKEDYVTASKYLSTSVFVIIGLIISFIPILALLVYKINFIFNISVELLTDAKVLFTFTLMSFALSLISSQLNVILYADNRLDYMNIIKSLRIGLKLLFVFVMFLLFEPNICYLGYSIFFCELFVLFVCLLFFYKTKPKNIHFKASYFDKKLLLGIAIMSSWVIIHQIGDTGIYRVDNIFVNNFWGLKTSGVLGAISELGVYVMISVSVISSLFGPLILIAYAKGNHEKVKQLTVKSSLYVGLITAVLIGLVIGLSEPILSLWLGDEFAPYSMWLIIKVVSVPFYTAAGVYAFVYRAINNVKFPAIGTLVIGLINLIVSYVVCNLFTNSENGIIILLSTTAFFVISQSYILNAYIYSRIYKGEGQKVVAIFFRIAAGLCIPILFSIICLSLFRIEGVLQLVCVAFAGGIFSLVTVYCFLLRKNERDELILLIKTK